MRKIIICDTDKCNGCRLCEYACAAFQDNSLNVRHSRMKVLRIEPIFNVAVSCVACDEPRCIEGCPTQAITWDERQKRIVIDKEKCVACGLCAERCKYGSITMALSDENMFVCDYCRDHGKPQCVEFCPKGALSYKKAPDASFQGIIRNIKDEDE
jgi:anaerobic dimethyl sulfoxide reductase subunit B (iron-sulfur subunit)